MGNKVGVTKEVNNKYKYIHSSLQSLALEIVENLNDRRPNCFAIYCGFIKKFGEQKIREILSATLEEYRLGKIDSKPKIFMWRLSQLK